MATARRGGQRERRAERRLLRLAAWLVEKREATREEIYEAFAADYRGDARAREKKWTRDKRDLKRVGIPVAFVEEEGERGVYVVDQVACTLPRLEFGPEEAAVLWLAGGAALRAHDHPLHEDLEVALRKLAVGAAGLPPRAAPLEADPGAPDPERTRALLEVIVDAVVRRKRLRVTYRKPGAAAEVREVDVYGYAWRGGHWIFVGHCHLRGALRLFLLSRVEALGLAAAGRRRHDYEVPEDFDLRTWSRQEPWDYLVHEPREARVRFTGSLARIAASLVPGGALSTEPDNARVARLVVRNLRGLVRQALAWGPEAEVLEPPEARALARELLAGMAAGLAGEAR